MLDIGCGAGASTVAAARAVGPEGAVALAPEIGPIPGVLRAREGTGADRAAILAELREALRPYVHPGGIAIPARVNLATATA